jgi:transcriptional regulator with XRE-family HTH domain
MDIRIIFGQVLKRVRKQKNISQEKLALDAELDRAHISKLENGVYQPNLSTIFALAKILGCSAGELMDMVEAEINKNI